MQHVIPNIAIVGKYINEGNDVEIDTCQSIIAHLLFSLDVVDQVNPYLLDGPTAVELRDRILAYKGIIPDDHAITLAYNQSTQLFFITHETMSGDGFADYIIGS